MTLHYFDTETTIGGFQNVYVKLLNPRSPGSFVGAPVSVFKKHYLQDVLVVLS